MDHPHTLVMHVWSIIRPLCINGDHWLILTNGQISIWCDFCTWPFHVLGFPIFIGWKKLDKSVVSRQSWRGYRMLKGTRQWACCRLGSQNARWRAISTAHHPLSPGYGNGTWKLTLLMIGSAPDGKKFYDSRAGPVYRDPASPRQIPYCYTNCRRDSRDTPATDQRQYGPPQAPPGQPERYVKSLKYSDPRFFPYWLSIVTSSPSNRIMLVPTLPWSPWHF